MAFAATFVRSFGASGAASSSAAGLARSAARATTARRMCTAVLSQYSDFETLAVTSPASKVVSVQLNRPSKSNAMNQTFWAEIRDVFQRLSEDSGCRAVLLSGAGKNFTAGLDLADHQDLLAPSSDAVGDPSRRALQLRKLLISYQASFTALEECSKPIVAAVHSACVGGGVDLICAADVRFCSADAYFCIKEVALGLAADVGTLQRMPKVMGNDSLVRELAYTSRNMGAEEALRAGFVSDVLADKQALDSRALQCATTIAAQSPIAVLGTKDNLNFARDHSTRSGLQYIAAWNQGMLQTADIPTAATAFMTGTEADYNDAGPE